MQLEENYMYPRQPENEENAMNDKIVAMSNQLAKSQINWTITQKKLFTMILEKLQWRKSGNPTEIELTKKDIMNSLKSEINTNCVSLYLRREFEKLIKHSFVEWENPEDQENFECGFLLTKFITTRNKVFVYINPEFMPHLEYLLKNFTMLLSSDVYNFRSGFSFDLYKSLMLYHNKAYLVNHHTFTTKELKRIFGLKKTDYVNKSSGKFDRYNFEKRTVEVAVREINENWNNGGMLYIKSWEKVKREGMVEGYKFYFIARTKPGNPIIIEQDGTEPDMQMTIDADGNTYYEPIADKDVLKRSE